jgi:hypothetical protein
VDRDAGGVIGAPGQVTNPQTQATCLLNSLVEEAIMLLSGREPRDRSDRMIANPCRALQYVREPRARDTKVLTRAIADLHVYLERKVAELREVDSRMH